MRGWVVRLLGNRWVIAGAAALVVWVGTGAVVARAPAEHAARSVVALEPREGRALPQAAMIRLLSTRYVAIASSPETARDVAEQLDLDAPDVAAAVTVALPETTANLELVVVTDSEDDSIAIAAAYADIVIGRSETDPDLVASLIVPASATGTVRTEARRTLMVGLAAGLAVGAGVVTAFSLWPRRRTH